MWSKLRALTRTAGDTPLPHVAAEARSHMGRVRTVNEDRFLSRSDRGFWAVADGMGGHGNGEMAASLVISGLEDLIEARGCFGDEEVIHALQHANSLLRTLEKPGTVSGATIVAARRDGDQMVVYWAGDSRAYRLSGQQVRLVTHDHSVVQELIDAGVLSKIEASNHPQAHVITRALGVARTIEIEKMRVPFRAGDTVLLCSDGLSRSLVAKDLTAPSHSLAYSADRLLANALRRDGSDNATLVLIERRG